MSWACLAVQAVVAAEEVTQAQQAPSVWADYLAHPLVVVVVGGTIGGWVGSRLTARRAARAFRSEQSWARRAGLYSRMSAAANCTMLFWQAVADTLLQHYLLDDKQRAMGEEAREALGEMREEMNRSGMFLDQWTRATSDIYLRTMSRLVDSALADYDDPISEEEILEADADATEYVPMIEETAVDDLDVQPPLRGTKAKIRHGRRILTVVRGKLLKARGVLDLAANRCQEAVNTEGDFDMGPTEMAIFGAVWRLSYACTGANRFPGWLRADLWALYGDYFDLRPSDLPGHLPLKADAALVQRLKQASDNTKTCAEKIQQVLRQPWVSRWRRAGRWLLNLLRRLKRRPGGRKRG